MSGGVTDKTGSLLQCNVPPQPPGPLSRIILHLLFVLFFNPGPDDWDSSLIFMTICHNSSFYIPSTVTHTERLLQPNKGISHQLEALQLYPSMSTTHFSYPTRGKINCYFAHIWLFCFSLCVLLWVSPISPARRIAVDERVQHLQLWPPGWLQHPPPGGGMILFKCSNEQKRQDLCLVSVQGLGTCLVPGCLRG